MNGCNGVNVCDHENTGGSHKVTLVEEYFAIWDVPNFFSWSIHNTCFFYQFESAKNRCKLNNWQPPWEDYDADEYKSKGRE